MTDYPFQIALLIQKSIVGVLTGEERKQLEQWLAEDDEHKRMYQELVGLDFWKRPGENTISFRLGRDIAVLWPENGRLTGCVSGNTGQRWLPWGHW